MALEAVVFPQDPFAYPCNKDYFYSLLENNFQDVENKAFVGIIDHSLHANWDSSSPSPLQNVKDQWDSHSSPEPCTADQSPPTAFPPPPSSTEAPTGRRKRRRTKSTKNKEEIENQRMTHIAVERNRRKQMNEYLAVLRSLMPPSYVQRVSLNIIPFIFKNKKFGPFSEIHVFGLFYNCCLFNLNLNKYSEMLQKAGWSSIYYWRRH